MTVSESQWYIGIDGGGTKCQAALFDRLGHQIANATTGPANPYQDYPGAIDAIESACERVLEHAGLPNDLLSTIPVGLGLAGVNVPKIHTQIAQHNFSFKHFEVTTDLHIACLGAHGATNAAILIFGTGSCAYAHVNGQQQTWGGYGFPAGDCGSGAWFGLKATEHTLLACDQFVDHSPLTHAILEEFDHQPIKLVSALTGATSQHYAALSSIVFEAAKQHDTFALTLIQTACAYIESLHQQCLNFGAERWSLSGGIADSLSPYLPNALTQTQTLPKNSPEYGAYLLIRDNVS